MDRHEAIERIKAHEGELRAAGITSLALFGSFARGDQHADSDIDLMCDLDPAQPIGLIAFAGLQARVAKLVGRPVDLVTRRAMRPRIRANAETDMVQVF